jgi:type-F conjugative transfer system pilin assembly protein TrbC
LEEKELLHILILIFLTIFSTTVFGSFFVISEKDIEYAEKLQAQVQKIVNKGLKEKYQEFTQVSKEAESVLNNTTSDAETQGVMGEDGTKLRILVSSSMSLNLLRSYYKEAQRYGGHLVFNGLPSGSFKELLKLAQEIVGSSEIGGIEIDDEAFKKLKAARVPMIVLSKEEDSLFSKDSSASKYDTIQGAVSIKYALEEFAAHGDLKEEAEQRLAR